MCPGMGLVSIHMWVCSFNSCCTLYVCMHFYRHFQCVPCYCSPAKGGETGDEGEERLSVCMCCLGSSYIVDIYHWYNSLLPSGASASLWLISVPDPRTREEGLVNLHT